LNIAAMVAKPNASSKQPWKREESAGGVVYRHVRGRTHVLLIRPKRDAEAEPAIWTFPKGWTGDHGHESREATALREVKEEGGVEAAIQQPLGSPTIFYRSGKDQVVKTIHYYLMKYVSGDPVRHDDEVAEAKWVELDQAKAMLSYKSDRTLIEKADRLLTESRNEG
jgi:ADP-ribose pyrophosphatase YjhB (NUDIX family)